MNILKPNEIKDLKEENEKLKKQIIMLENKINIMRDKHELDKLMHKDIVKTLQFINFIASALIISNYSSSSEN